MLASQAERYATASRWSCSTSTASRPTTTPPGTWPGTMCCAPWPARLPICAESGDSVYRYGGEELLAILPAQDLEGAAVAAERMRHEVESLRFRTRNRPAPGVVTLSGGVACYSPDDGGDPARS